jgi:DNA-binding beta-propeller fold protein YncE
MVVVGSGRFTYELAEGWEQLPPGWSHPDVAGVAVDSQDRVYVFNRGEHPVIVYDRDGRFLDAWGHGIFTMAHAITIGPDDSVYCVDASDHTVRKFTPDGKLLLTLGAKDRPSDTGYTGTIESIRRGGPPFNRPTKLAIAPNGDLYVSDGYGNCRVHRFAPSGELLQSWGEPGTGPGQFHLPHGIGVAPDGRVFVCDRENERIQVFSPVGAYLEQWTDVQRPTQVSIRAGLVYVAELAWRPGTRSYARGEFATWQHGRVSVFDLEGRLLARFGGPDVCAPGSFCAPHSICADSRGDIYVGEVTWTFAGREGLVPPDCHTLQKFARR